MRIINDFNHFKSKKEKLVLALGNFDGLHLGHQKLLQYVAGQARKHQARAAVFTFKDHPQSVLHPKGKPFLLHSLGQKLFLLAQAGMDYCFLQSFTPNFSKMSAEDFVKKVLVQKLHVLEVCMGHGARFGCAREGDAHLMKKLAKRYSFFFKEMAPVKMGGLTVSSTLIRKWVIEGELGKAAKGLGRPLSVFGRIIRGRGHGGTLGFPTANLEVDHPASLPLGVYIASARFLPQGIFREAEREVKAKKNLAPWLPGVLNFGRRPTFPEAQTPRPILELHLLDFKGQLYGKNMEVALHAFIRPETRFPNDEALKVQIAADVRKAKAYHKKRF